MSTAIRNLKNGKGKFPGPTLHVMRNVGIRLNAKRLARSLPKTQSKASIPSQTFLLNIEPEVMAALIRERERGKTHKHGKGRR